MSAGYVIYHCTLFTNKRCALSLYISAWAISALLVQTGWAMRRPLKCGTSNRYRFPRFFFVYACLYLFETVWFGESTGKKNCCDMEPIGKMIKNKVEEQGRSIQWLADKLSCHRSNIYDIFNRENIDVSLLIRISSVLNYNFLKDIADNLDDDMH